LIFWIALIVFGAKNFAMKRMIVVLLAGVALTSCNTMIGLGRDFRQLGEGMENKAQGKKFDGSTPQSQQDGNFPTY
jgi:predicted small secreted protein